MSAVLIPEDGFAPDTFLGAAGVIASTLGFPQPRFPLPPSPILPAQLPCHTRHSASCMRKGQRNHAMVPEEGASLPWS